MPTDNGDGGERLAPVTYLPGAEPGSQRNAPRGQAEPIRAVGSPRRPVTFSPEYWAEDEEPVALAPRHERPAAGDRHAESASRAESYSREESYSHEESDPDHEGIAGAADVEGATQALVKRLRTRQLSVKEARTMLGERGIDSSAAEGVIADFEARGYLDDSRLAEQLVYAATHRKGQGRRAIAQTLSGRGIAREVVDAALDDLPDDEAERALEFARQKARSMGSLDREAAVRRLHGQLARRGFGGSLAMTAAKQALDEDGVGASGVRFR